MRAERQLSAHPSFSSVLCFAPVHRCLPLAKDDGCEDRKSLNGSRSTANQQEVATRLIARADAALRRTAELHSLLQEAFSASAPRGSSERSNALASLRHVSADLAVQPSGLQDLNATGHSRQPHLRTNLRSTAKTVSENQNFLTVWVVGEILQRKFSAGAPERIRTSGLCLRRAALYPAELRVRVSISLFELSKDRKFNHANSSRQNSSPSTSLSTSLLVL